ncbi:MAG: hypothetical protein LJE70_16715 [Chromatiaceae bacterium]|nr:hypothetical protein [Chromatiaceae bacterium]
MIELDEAAPHRVFADHLAHAQQRRQDVDARADVYGLGITAVLALRGVDPDLYEVRSDRDGFIDWLPISAAVKPVLSRAVAWKALDRYETIDTFCAALRQARAGRVRGSCIPDQRR